MYLGRQYNVKCNLGAPMHYNDDHNHVLMAAPSNWRPWYMSEVRRPQATTTTTINYLEFPLNYLLQRVEYLAAV